MQKKALIGLAITFLGLFILMEIGIRAIGTYDLDGNFTLGTRTLYPLKIPYHRVQEMLSDYTRYDNAYISYDSITGWIPNPNFISENNWNHHDGQGIRISENFPPTQYTDTHFRIVGLFGDSYVYGDEVPDEENICYYLNQYFIEKNSNFRAINFGIGGADMGQALQRMSTLQDINVEVYAFGFQAENILRNINLFRSIYNVHALLPFSKPRYYLNQDSLMLYNWPCMKPHEILTKIHDKAILETYEAHYDYRFREKWYHRSKLVSWVEHIILINRFNHYQQNKTHYDIHSKTATLSLAIIHEMKKITISRNAAFMLFHLANKMDYLAANKKIPLLQSEILKTLSDTYAIMPHPTLVDVDIEPFFEANQHYSPKMNQYYAQQLGIWITQHY